MKAPVQLLTIGVNEAKVPDAVFAEFMRLEQLGLVRVLDVLFVHHAADGDVDSLDRVDAERMQFDGSLLTALLTTEDATPASSEAPAWSIHDVIPQGQMAALVLLEHLWAEPLVTTMLASGGSYLDEFWLSAEDRDQIDAIRAARS